MVHLMPTIPKSNRKKDQMKKHRITLRHKAILSIFLTYLLLTTYFLYYTFVNQHRTVEEEALKDAAEAANLISFNLSGYLLRKDKIMLQKIADHLLETRNVEYVRFKDMDGKILVESGLRGKYPMATVIDGSDILEIGRPAGLLHRAGHLFYLHKPIMHNTREIGSMHLGITTQTANAQLAKTIYGAITIFIITILGGVMLTYFMESKMRGTLKRLIKTTEHIAQGDLNRRIEIHIGDEVEDLGNAFNRMAQALSDKEAELIQAKNTMDSIFNGITAGIAYISEDYRIIHANPTYWALQANVDEGTSREPLKCFDLLWQAKEACTNCPGKSAMETGQPASLGKEIRTQEGKKNILWIHAYPVRDEKGMPGGFIEYVMDITQQRKLEMDLKIYTEQLEDIVQERTRELKVAQVQINHQEKMAALGQMAAGIAHEIGNPLAALSSLVQSMDIRKAGDEKNALMKDQIKRMSNIVKEMTDFARPASHHIRLSHINQMIQSALGISRYDPRLNEINISTSLDSEIPALKLDEDQLLQVFMNLILNAADAMGGKGSLTIISRLKEHAIDIRFEDTGPGISEDLIARIFEPFFTTKDAGSGTGLGLSVSYGIIQSMGGEIKASNRKKGGAVFAVTIPFPSKGQRNHEN